MLPFLAGLAVGTALTILYAKRDEVKKAFNSPEFQGKVEETKRASKRAFDDVKDKVGSLGLADKAKEIFANLKGEKGKKAPKNSKASTEKSASKSTAGRKTSTKSKTTSPKTKRTTSTRAKRSTKTATNTTNSNTSATNTDANLF